MSYITLRPAVYTVTLRTEEGRIVLSNKGSDAYVLRLLVGQIVEVPVGPPGPAGPQGPAGPAGPAGESAANYTHVQASASDTWTINHNLGFKPAVELYTTGGREFDGDILHTSVNQVIVYLNSPIAGSARLN